ncbi:MAG TPA: HAD-IB family hydrolase [Hellea balneolensis]|uniref:HAD-IB family hydrolase n=1 Tax=Hellea balneolensis TaxID=287478 RepID=A0A7C5R4R8_9PROT|nr:HAD-IB family hydrolase [Hellea balneolensis]
MARKDLQKIVIVDLDETLTKKGTWGRFVTRSIRHQPHKWVPFFLSSLGQQILYMAGIGPREHVKEKMMRWTLSGRSKQDLQAMAEVFAEKEVKDGLRNRSLTVLDRHRKQGARIILASAAVDLICDPIARRLGIDEVVCTKTAYDEHGRLARKLGGQNCYGQGKLELVKAHLEQEPDFTRAGVHITMYSDSRSDLAILQWADVGIAVNPSPRLRKHCEQYGFEIQDWDEEETSA